MYKLHLILKYLRKRRIAWVSLIAVMLCTTMVLVVISVMGGWLRMFRTSFRGLTGDIVVSSQSLTGFAHYQDMIKDMEALPGVEAAVPTIRTFALMRINNGNPDAVQVLGYPIDQIGRVNNFPQSLHRQYEVPISEGKKPPPPSFGLIPGMDYSAIAPPGMKDPTRYSGMIVGAAKVGIGKDKDGHVQRPEGLYEAFVKLDVMALDEGAVSLERARVTPNYYWIVDDSHTGVWANDAKTVYVDFKKLQKDLGMAERPTFDDNGKQNGVDLARTTDISIKARPGIDLYALKPKIIDVVAKYYPYVNGNDADSPIIVQTWEEVNKELLGAVEKEKELVTLLFGMISIVAIFLIFCIFYMIVMEKTRDIGIIKSVGATSSGVAGIFLGYGLTIGILGAGLGLLCGYLIVHNINYLHDLIHHLTGAYVWDPEVYAFDTIPNTMNPHEVFWICLIAVISSVLGALVPAIRAAEMNPVEALRWE